MAETIYAVGTVSVSNGGTTVTGVGTSWQGKIFEGDLFTDPAQGIFARVTADATSNTSLSINAWPGTALSGDAYEILLMPDSVRASERTRQLLEQLSVVQANGRGLFYLFSDTTTDADPGAGYIRINNADPALATAAYIDVLDANGATVSGEIDTWDDSTSLGKGNVWVRGIADPSAFHAYELTGSVVDGTGYRKLTLTYIGGSGSFAADDELMVAFARTGDTGEGYVTDATVADPSELTALEGEAAGYLVFVTDLQTDFGAYSGRSGVVELVAGPDWALVAIYTGPQGIQGPQGGTGPTGPKGINWQGDYSGATAYVEDDGVLYNGSSWRALGATTGNAPPTLPTTSNAYWQLLARQGIDGAGTVNSVVAGTGVAVDNTDPTAPIVSAPTAVRFDAQSLDASEKGQARDNIGAIDLTGMVDLIINGMGQVDQRAYTAVGDDNYWCDRHYTLTQSGAVGVSVLADVEDGLPSMMRITQTQASAQRFGNAQIVEAFISKSMRGEKVTLGGKLRCSSAQPLRYAILEWTGTADSVTSDVVNDWASGIYTGGNFFVGSGLTVAAIGSITPLANTLTDFQLVADVSSACNNLIVFAWTEGTAAQNVTLDMAWSLMPGNWAASDWPYVRPRDLQRERALCQRYAVRFGGDGAYSVIGFGRVASGGSEVFGITPLPVDMRIKPSLVYSGSFEASGVQINSFTLSSASTTRKAAAYNGVLASSLTNGAATEVLARNDSSARFILDSEL